MGFFDRALLTVYTLCLALMSLALSLVAVTGFNPFKDFFAGNNLFQQKAVLFILSLVFFLVSLRLLTVSLGSKDKKLQCIIHDGPVGQTLISATALDNMIMKVSQQVRGIKEIKPRTFCDQEGLHVLIQAKVTPDISIPQISEELQLRVRDYLQETAGAVVKDIRVVIENISGSEGRARVE